ncbi:hypothetical protein EVAR_91637_1 [Eumeta japonica]|uniref:Uncharacterized protein n=1 Tax=Eumeta variegata TaxID=151549 RepID=A0A4C2A623_EUMVA|nr:hypothetical protein EVAR_91637_1 [Eumeta japonica]
MCDSDPVTNPEPRAAQPHRGPRATRADSRRNVISKFNGLAQAQLPPRAGRQPLRNALKYYPRGNDISASSITGFLQRFKRFPCPFLDTDHAIKIKKKAITRYVRSSGSEDLAETTFREACKRDTPAKNLKEFLTKAHLASAIRCFVCSCGLREKTLPARIVGHSRRPRPPPARMLSPARQVRCEPSRSLHAQVLQVLEKCSLT